MNQAKYLSSFGHGDSEFYAKLKKASGLSSEDAMKALEIKKEIDSLFDQKVYQQESSNSSEESFSNCGSTEHFLRDYSPTSREKFRAEKKY